MYSVKIDELSKFVYKEAMKSAKALRNIQMSLLSMQISAAKMIDRNEARVLDVISSDMKKAIEIIEESATVSGKCVSEINKINEEGAL